MKDIAHEIAATVLFSFIVGAYLLMAFNFPTAYIVATYEDLAGEWAQVLFCLTVMIMALKLALVQSRYRFFYIIIALGSFYVVMEEISWGATVVGSRYH